MIKVPHHGNPDWDGELGDWSVSAISLEPMLFDKITSVHWILLNGKAEFCVLLPYSVTVKAFPQLYCPPAPTTQSTYPPTYAPTVETYTPAPTYTPTTETYTNTPTTQTYTPTTQHYPPTPSPSPAY